MITLNIITPLSKPANLIHLLKNIAENSKKIKINWYIAFDKVKEDMYEFWSKKLENYETDNLTITTLLSPIEKAIAGHAHRNFILNYFEEIGKNVNEWVYNLDDDNLLHPNFIDYLLKEEGELRKSLGVIFSQEMKDGSRRLTADFFNVKVCHVDTAMLCCKLYAINKLRFIETDYCADGHFIEAVFNEQPHMFIIEKEPLCYYNYLT